jgi:lipoprotein-releasing system permease protein
VVGCIVQLSFALATAFMRRKKSWAPNFTTLVSTLGVAVGVASFLVVMTVFSSFENQLRTILMGANPHLMVFRIPNGIPNVRTYQDDLLKKIDSPIETVAFFEYSEVVMSKGVRTAAAIVKGLEGTKGASGPDLGKLVSPSNSFENLDTPSAGAMEYFRQESVVKPSLDLVPVVLGKGLALKLDAKQGDTVTFVTNPFGGKNSAVQKLRVVGVLSVGLAQYDEKLALLNFYDASALFGAPGEAKGIEIRFRNPQDASIIAKKIERKIPYGVKAWQDLNADLFAQIDRDGSAIKVIVLIISFVAAFNIIVTLSLAVVDRTKQIALLRSLGASRPLIVTTFVAMGFVLGVVGSVLGVILGLIVLRLFAGFELGELQAFYFLERIPVDYDPKLILMACVVAIAMSLLSALYPAWKATAISPLYGLKPGA